MDRRRQRRGAARADRCGPQAPAHRGEAGLAEEVANKAVPAIRIRSFLAPRKMAIGDSRLGGRPDLPHGHAWPEVRGAPMAFLCQLRCEELAAAAPGCGLPSQGLLVVFAGLEPESQAPLGVHVEVVDDSQLTRARVRASLPEEQRYEVALAVAEPALSPPDPTVLVQTVSEDAARRFAALARLPGPQHQLFGHPSTIQGAEPSGGYELLLQFDGDSLLGATFADGGRLLVWYPRGTPLAGVINGCILDLDSG